MTDGARLYQRLRGGLYKKLPALALPLGLLDWETGQEGLPGTDGVKFFAQTDWLQSAPREDGEQTLLHSLLHAMLGHVTLRGGEEAARWDLACDLAAEFLRARMMRLPLTGALGRAFYACKPGEAFSAQALYRRLGEDQAEDAATLRALVRRDSHAYWQRAQTRLLARASGGETGEGADALWKRQREKLLPYMQPDKPKIGTGTAGQRLDIPQIPENHTRFAQLLRAFAVTQENRRVNDADFAYSWYAYGMACSDGVMPLIEPLEYSEERRLQEMVIVLDTSASCSRGLAVRFLGAVHAIVARERLFFEHFRLYILQCDCEVQQETLVTNLDEFQWYMEHLELYGGGGTDFRPAFGRIDALVAAGELPRLGGVLYFTDGYGVFPEKAPDYPAAFVMLQYRYDDINLPRWALKLVLDAEKPGRDEGWI